MRILFVCTGNTCRSPMAESIARTMAEKMGLSHTFASAGVSTWDGLSASSGAMDAVEPYGADLTEHQSMRVRPDLLEDADAVLAMTNGHKQMLIAGYPEFREKIYTLTEYAGLEGDIQDPYGQDASVYEQTAKQIVRALEKIIK